ncbi:hypothetical protein [Capnocytophaga cynodegmi]|uniref:hypothetical protein n=2 Tax=Capnocytophaga cynodegmi TaxID=28189 RepID=UPI0038594E8C
MVCWERTTIYLLSILKDIMKQFLIKFLIFSIPIFFISIFMEFLLRNIPNDYLLKKQYLDKNSYKIETLILGSSHSFYGLNPEYFDSNTFNASHISQSLNYDYEILKKYQKKFKKLKTIVLPASYFTLFAKLEESHEPWRIKNYGIYYDMNLKKSLANYSEVFSTRLNLNVRRIVSYYLLGNPSISCTKLGWGTSFNSKDTEDFIESGTIAAERHTMEINSYKYKKIFNDNVLILKSIIQWSKVNNIKVLFLTFPAFETYCQNLNKEQLKITFDTINYICSTYENCSYENLLSDKNFLPIDFYDADHLSEIGAKKLSILINEKINKLISTK